MQADCEESFVSGGNMTERERMLSGKLYNPYKVSDNPWAEIRAACKKFNESDFWCDSSALEELKNILPEPGKIWFLCRRFIVTMGIRFILESIFMQIPD